MKAFLFFTAVLISSNLLNAQTIYDIQGQADESPYKDQTVTTKGIVTAVYSSSYFIQDGDSAWTGLFVYDQQQTPVLGDSILLTGLIVEYYGLTELKDITDYSVMSSNNTVPQPIVVETGDIQEKWEGVFIKIENAVCTNADMGYGEWEVNDGTGAVVVNDMGVSYTPILGVSYFVTGPLDYSYSAYKIEPRTLDDIVQDLPLFFTVNPYAQNIEKTGFDISWETNENASSYVQYGLTAEYELGSAFSTVSSTTHTISIDELDAGNIYYAKAYSVNANNDTTPVNYGVYATQSGSGGEINTYFNHQRIEIPIKNGFTNSIVDTIINYIEKAQISLDITIYDLTNHALQSDSSNYRLIQAVNKAYGQGVNIRFITDDSPANYALDSLNPSIPLLKGNINGIMHNKFLIIDAENVGNSWVITGSTNWTYNNLFMDFNNVVCIQDQSLAKAYQIEFNEMWGSNGMTPDIDNSKFGNEKTDNTPHLFNINNVAVELYFSPSDKTTSKIANAIDSAKNSIDFAMMVFTENKLGNALVSAKNRGVNTFGFIDYVEYSGSEYNYLLESGVIVYDFLNRDGSVWPDGKTLHHKFCVIDNNGDNPLTITGTHNWTASAESKNDENTLFIYDKSVCDIFVDELMQIYEYSIGSGIKQTDEKGFVNIYPNPSNGNFTLFFDDENYTIAVFDMKGRQINSFMANGTTTNITIQKSGLYVIQVTGNNKRVYKKVVVW